MNRKHSPSGTIGTRSTVRVRSAKTLHFHQILIVGFPAKPQKIFPPPSRLSRKSDTLQLIRSNIRRGPERLRRRCGRRCQRRTWTSDWRLLQRVIDSQQSAFNKGWGAIGTTTDVLFERTARKARPDRRPHRLSSAGACMAPHRIIGQVPAGADRKPRALQPARPTRALRTHAGRSVNILSHHHWSLNPCQKAHRIRLRSLPPRKFDRDMQIPPETQVVIDFDDNRAASALVGPYGPKPGARSSAGSASSSIHAATTSPSPARETAATRPAAFWRRSTAQAVQGHELAQAMSRARSAP